jgi:hypothetical protein
MATYSSRHFEKHNNLFPEYGFLNDVIYTNNEIDIDNLPIEKQKELYYYLSSAFEDFNKNPQKMN